MPPVESRPLHPSLLKARIKRPVENHPLSQKSFDVAAGTMCYMDIGSGDPVVFVHGNPSSSKEFTPAVRELSGSYRCIAPDHIGFGVSDKPPTWDYLPSSHAANLAALLDHLELDDVTLVVGDWGGPIGLAWALDNPHRTKGLVITNTWLWSVRRSLYYQGFSKFMGGPIGRTLTRRYNFFARQVTRRAWGTQTPLTPELYAEFTGVHTSPSERTGMWVFPREIIGSSAWLTSLWKRRELLTSIPMTLLWGMRDIAFRSDILEVWMDEFPEAQVERLPDVGHFPALEATDRFVEAVRATNRSS